MMLAVNYKNYPDSTGFWWMKDSRCYDWEVVRVEFYNQEFQIFRCGNKNAEKIESWCKEWIKLEIPK